MTDYRAEMAVIDYGTVALEYTDSEGKYATTTLTVRDGEGLLEMYDRELVALRDLINGVLIDRDVEKPKAPVNVGTAYINLELSGQSVDRVKLLIAEQVQAFALDGIALGMQTGEGSPLHLLAKVTDRYQED